MGRSGKGDEQEKPKALRAPQVRTMKDQEIKREHGQTGKDVGQQHAAQHRQCGESGEPGDHSGQEPGPAAEPKRPQQQPDHPDGACRLQHELWPEMETLAHVQEQPVNRRPARHEVAFIPAGEISPGVVLQQRVAVPQRRREQRHETEQRCREMGRANCPLRVRRNRRLGHGILEEGYMVTDLRRLEEAILLDAT
jgi:hypothetical protein